VDPIRSRLYVSDIIQNLVYVIDSRTKQILTTIAVPDNPSQMAINLRLNRIYVAEFGGSLVAVLDGNTETLIDSIPVILPQNIAVNPLNDRVYISSNNFFGAVTAVDGRTNGVIATIRTAGQFTVGVDVDFIRNLVYAADESGTLNVIDGATNTLLSSVQTNTVLVDSRVNPFTNRVYVNENNTNQVAIFAGRTLQQIGSLPAGGGPSQSAIDLVNQRLFVGNPFSNDVTIINTQP
jgi:YVTN family beta-propeller protein